MLNKTGVPTPEQVEAVKPSPERLAEGPVVIVECFQEIPCDPCYTACKRGGFLPFEDINDLPQMDFEKCNGCGICIGACPGLAVFVVDETYAEDQALLMIPWEFLPVPAEGSTVKGLNREGEALADVEVKKVRSAGRHNQASILTLIVPKKYAHYIRSIGAE